MPLHENLKEFVSLTVLPLEKAKPLHPLFYTDEDYSRCEVKHIFGTQWFAAAHASELPRPGDVKVVDVAGTSIILTRDKRNKINAFYNVCRHRGSRICKASQTGVKQLVCPYHWWAYRLDGTLKSTPPAVMPKEKKENLPLHSVPGLEIFAGIIFLNQQKNPPPFMKVLGDLPKKVRRYDFDELELHGQKEYDIKGDWKLVAENFVDFYHINAVHPELAKYSRVDDHSPYQGHGHYCGFVTSPLTDCDGPGDAGNFNPFQRLSVAESSAALFFHIFPNISITIYPHSIYTLLTLPGKPGETRETLTLLMAPGAKLNSDSEDLYRSKCDSLMDFVVNINNEDVEAIELLQEGLKNASTMGIQGEYVPKYDWPLHRFHNILVRSFDQGYLAEDAMPNLCSKFETQVNSGISHV